MLPILVSRARPALFDHRNPDPLGELLHRCRKFQMLVIHHEPENAAARAAPEAMESLARWTHRKRRRLFLVKRAERLEGRAGALKREISANHLDDVVGSGDLLDGL